MPQHAPAYRKAVNAPPSEPIDLVPEGGSGGGGKERQMALARGVRQRRLERMVAKAKLNLARQSADHAEADAGACLKTLRVGLKAQWKPPGAKRSRVDYRERRLSAEALLHHHREAAKIDPSAEPTAPVDPQGGQHLHVHLHRPTDPEAERALLAGLAAAVGESEGVVPPKPEDRDPPKREAHKQNGHTNGVGP